MSYSSKNAIFMLFILFSICSYSLSTDQIMKGYAIQGQPAPGQFVLKHDIISLTTRMLFGAADPYNGCNMVNVEKPTETFTSESRKDNPKNFRVLSACAAGGGGNLIILSESLLITPSDKFRIKCANTPTSVVKVSEKYKLNWERLEVYCGEDNSIAGEGEDDQFFKFNYVLSHASGPVRYYDSIQIMHIKTKTYLTVDPTEYVSNTLRGFYAGRESMNEMSFMYFNSNQNYQGALQGYSLSKMFQGKMLLNKDQIMLINADELGVIRFANNGNDNLNKDGESLPVLSLLSFVYNDPGKVVGTTQYFSNGSILKFSFSDSGYLAVNKGKTAYNKENLYTGFFYSGMSQEWELEIVWGQDNAKGYLRSGDIIRLKNKDQGCHLKASSKAPILYGGDIWTGEVSCLNNASKTEKKTMWYIVSYYRTDDQAIRMDRLPVAKGFTPGAAKPDPIYPDYDLFNNMY